MTKKRAAGGGRKPLNPNEKTTKVAITLLPSQVEAMEQLGNGNLSAGIRKAIENMTTQTATTQTIVINNPNLTRKWGWGWTNTPTGRDAYSIEIPAGPDYTGTLKQVSKAISEDRTYASMKSGGTFTNTAWFYDDKRIVNRDDFRNWLEWTDCKEPVTLILEVKE